MLEKIISLGFSKPEAQELLKVSKNIDNDIEKLKEGYPIQYLIGYVNFYGLNIKVNENVLIPRYETEFLVEKTINYSKMFNNKVKILDIGTGSGAIAIALSKKINCDVDAVDISNEALNVASINAIDNNSNINFIQSDLFKNINNKYDIIISNPPYIGEDEKIMDSVDKYEPHLALYAKDNGLYFYKRILEDAKNYLNDKFIIAFEIGCLQANSIMQIAQNYFSNANIIVEKDLSGKDRYLFIINE